MLARGFPRVLRTLVHEDQKGTGSAVLSHIKVHEQEWFDKGNSGHDDPVVTASPKLPAAAKAAASSVLPVAAKAATGGGTASSGYPEAPWPPWAGVQATAKAGAGTGTTSKAHASSSAALPSTATVPARVPGKSASKPSQAKRDVGAAAAKAATNPGVASSGSTEEPAPKRARPSQSQAVIAAAKAATAAAALPKSAAAAVAQAANSVCTEKDNLFPRENDNYMISLKWVALMMMIAVITTALVTAWCCSRSRATTPTEGNEGHRRIETTTRTVNTQSQVQYTWWKTTPRFKPTEPNKKCVWIEEEVAAT